MAVWKMDRKARDVLACMDGRIDRKFSYEIF